MILTRIPCFYFRTGEATIVNHAFKVTRPNSGVQMKPNTAFYTQRSNHLRQKEKLSHWLTGQSMTS